MTQLRLALLPALLLGTGLAACAPYPAEPYYAVSPVAPGYAAAPVDTYCREAYAAAAGAQQEAAITRSYEAAARAARADGFFRRDC